MALKEIILFTTSVLPVIIIGKFIYKKDKEKEPAKLLTKLFLGGIASCFLTLFLTLILDMIFPILNIEDQKLNLIQLLFKVFIEIALVEEFSKWIILYKISYNDQDFDVYFDMIVYAIFVSLGFACFENLLYVYQKGISTGLLRAILAVPGHACYGFFMGCYLGIAKINALNNRKKHEKKYIAFSIIIPTIAHGIYDYCLFAKHIPFIIIFIVFVLAMYIYTLKKLKKVSTLNRKMKYKDNYCPNCGHVVETDYCPICGRKNE